MTPQSKGHIIHAVIIWIGSTLGVISGLGVYELLDWGKF